MAPLSKNLEKMLDDDEILHKHSIFDCISSLNIVGVFSVLVLLDFFFISLTTTQVIEV
jgi:hypothetical protein